MRNGFLCTLALLIGAGLAQAQQWPTYGYPQYQAYGYPQYYSGYGYPQYPGYAPGYNMPRPAYYPGYQQQQWTPQQVQVNSALVYPRAGYATPANPQGAAMQSSYPPPRVVSLPQTAGQSVPEPLPTGPDHATSAPVVPQPAQVLPPASCCGAGCCAGCDHNDLLCPPKEPCKPECKHECFWITANFLMAFAKPQINIPLVTTGFIGVGGVGGDDVPGALGQPTTSVLFGNSNVNYNLIPGFEIAGGIWLDRDNHFSVDAAGFYLPTVHQNFSMASDPTGSPLITRPVVDATSGLEEAFIVAFPGRVAGDITVANSLTMWGAEINGRCHLPLGCHCRLEGLAGVRYLNLVETLNVDEDLVPLVGGGASGLTFLANPVDPGNSITTRDAFRTANQFVGFQLGGAVRFENERFFFDIHAKGAIGVNQQSVQISGVSILNDSVGIPLSVAPGGILALPSNIGNHNRSLVAVVPEGGFTAGVNVTSWMRLVAGYSFLYMNNVVRPVAHIDRVVNPGQVPTDADFAATGGPTRPTFQFHEDGFWIHMFSLGVEFHY